VLMMEARMAQASAPRGEPENSALMGWTPPDGI
jgi:hypothetical protein